MTSTRVPLLAFAVAAGALTIATAILLVVGAGSTTPADDFGLTGLAGLTFLIAAVSFMGVGSLVASRMPDNAIGWILCGTGVLIGVGDLAYQYADVALFVEPGSLPAGDAAAWMQNLGLPPAFGLLGLCLLLFPDGRLPSRRWRPVLWVALGGITLIVIEYAFRPGPLDDPFASVTNPLGVGATEIEGVSGLGWPLMGLSVVLSAVGMVRRFRRSSGAERQQFKWIALAAAVAGLVIAAQVSGFFFDANATNNVQLAVLGLAFAGFPLAAGVAILRYRLYDIDVVINRTLVYGALTATLAAVYLGSVLLFQLALGGLTEGSNLAIAGSTLAVAALVRPARSRIQELVDRRFYRRRYDARQTLESFSARLRDEVDLTALDTELRGVVSETMQPAHVSLWLRGMKAGSA